MASCDLYYNIVATNEGNLVKIRPGKANGMLNVDWKSG